MVKTIKIKIMPSSPDVDLENIKNSAKEIIESNNGMRSTFEEEPIAFGLKAIIALFAWPEEKELDETEKELDMVASAFQQQLYQLLKCLTKI